MLAGGSSSPGVPAGGSFLVAIEVDGGVTTEIGLFKRPFLGGGIVWSWTVEILLWFPRICQSI